MPLRRVVVVRAGALGDFVLTLPALEALRRRFPDAAIDLIGNASAGMLARSSGYVDRVFSIDERWVTSLFAEAPDDAARQVLAGADLAVVWLSNANAIGESIRAAGVVDVLAASPHPSEHTSHVADHLVATLAPLGVDPGARRPTIRLGATELARARQALAEAGIDSGRHFVALHPGSGSRFKNWPVAQFGRLAVRLSRTTEGNVLVVAGPADDTALADLLASATRWDPPSAPLRTIRPASVVDLAAVLTLASGYVGNDSGVTHVAAAVGAPTVAIFGPTNPRRWAPRGDAVEVVRTGIACSPCSWPIMQSCPHRSCLTQLDPDQVWSALERVRSMR